jgi:hypothetical protein
MKDVTDIPKAELHQKLQRHIDEARLDYQAALLQVCLDGPIQLTVFQTALARYTDLAKVAMFLAAE